MYNTQEMRVLFTTSPGRGHVHPMVPLAKAFVDQGHAVLWAAAGPVCARLEREGFRAVEAGLDEAASMAEFAQRFPEVRTLAPAERPDFMFPRLFGDVRAGPMLAGVLPVARDWRPSLVVSEAAELAGPIAAAATGVPGVTHAFGALLPAARVAAAATRVAPLWEAEGLAPRPFGGLYDHPYLDIYPRSLQAAETSHVPAMQPLRPVASAGPAGDDLPALVTGPSSAPLVYVTFGTVFNQDLGPLATVLQALSDLPIRVVATMGPQGQPERLGPQPAKVHLARYIPQTELLPRTTAVVSHAGSGTFLAALGHGLPQVCLPQAADQFLNAAACARSGAGLSLQPTEATVDAVRHSVQRILSDDRFRASAGRLRAEIESMPSPDEIARLLAERFGETPHPARPAGRMRLSAGTNPPYS